MDRLLDEDRSGSVIRSAATVGFSIFVSRRPGSAGNTALPDRCCAIQLIYAGKRSVILPRFWLKLESRRIRWTRFVAVLCVLLFVCAATVQIAHAHPFTKSQEHCQICMAIHSAMPATSGAAAVSFGIAQTLVTAFVSDSPARFWSYSLANRPPPFEAA